MDRILAYIIITLNMIFACSFTYGKAIYHFETMQQEQHYYRYIDTIRCLVCQNESIKDSNAPLAGQLRQLIYDRMLSGEDEDQITTYLRSRYGDFIEYKPAFSALTAAIWVFPWLFLIAGCYLLNRQRTSK